MSRRGRGKGSRVPVSIYASAVRSERGDKLWFYPRLTEASALIHYSRKPARDE